MTLVAGRGYMSAVQRKPRLLVPRQGEGGRPVSGQVVALLALVEVRGARELALVFVLVAVSAVGEFQLVNRGPARGNMALLAAHAGVLALQRVSAGGVLLDPEHRRPETVHVVAGRALALIGALYELSLVRVLVAIGTLLEGDRLLEISSGMALVAAHLNMLAQQGKPGLRVVEPLAHRRRRHALPAAGVVTGLAAAGEGAMVRIGVAGTAGAERQAHILRLAVRSRQVAFLAGHLLMQPGQGIARPAMIELGQGNGEALPAIEAVALLAVLPQPALVLVHMASHAGARHSQIRAVQVLDGNGRALGGRDMRRGVAARARQARVLAFQGVAGFAVVEGAGRRVPADKREILAVVFGVATGAFLLAGADGPKRGVQAALGRYPAGNIGVALQAFEAGRARRQLVAADTLRGAAQRLVRPRKGTRRDLRPAHGRQQQKQGQDQNPWPSVHRQAEHGPLRGTTFPEIVVQAQRSEQADVSLLPTRTAHDRLRKWTGGV